MERTGAETEFHPQHWRIKTQLRSFKSIGHINEKREGSYRGFGYLSLFSDPLDLEKIEPKKNTVILQVAIPKLLS